jgi:hypothetical protein
VLEEEVVVLLFIKELLVQYRELRHQLHLPSLCMVQAVAVEVSVQEQESLVEPVVLVVMDTF